MKDLTKFITAGFLLLMSTVHASNLPPGLIQPTPFKAPMIQVNDIDGEAFGPADYQGKWLFVHFWASWCSPCRREVPAIEKMWQTMQHQNMAIAFINTAESEDTIFSFIGIHAPGLRPLMDKDGMLTEQWQPRGLPATYLVDPSGIVRYQALGGREWNSPTYLNFLRQLLKK